MQMEELEESQNWKDKKWMFQDRLDLWLFQTRSIPTFPRSWHVMNPWPPLNPSDGGKSSRGQPSSWLKFLLFIPKPSPFVSSSAKKTLLLKFFPLVLAQTCLRCTKPWCSYSALTRRHNENKRSLKAMNHVCHHQRGGWCGSPLGSHKPLEVIEEVRADLYTHKRARMHRCSRARTKNARLFRLKTVSFSLKVTILNYQILHAIKKAIKSQFCVWLQQSSINCTFIVN